MLEQFIYDFGYIIVILGTFFEGEGIMLIFGYLSNSGLLNIYLVIIFGFFGTIFFEISLFLLGYIKGEPILKKIPFLKYKNIVKTKKLVKKYDTTYILIYRFIFGARLASILMLGISKVKISKFIIYNSLVALMWVSVFSLAGFFLGRTFVKLINNLSLEITILSIIITIFIIYILKQTQKLNK